MKMMSKLKIITMLAIIFSCSFSYAETEDDVCKTTYLERIGQKYAADQYREQNCLLRLIYKELKRANDINESKK